MSSPLLSAESEVDRLLREEEEAAAAHYAKKREASRRYYAANPDKCKAYNANRAAKPRAEREPRAVLSDEERKRRVREHAKVKYQQNKEQNSLKQKLARQKRRQALLRYEARQAATQLEPASPSVIEAIVSEPIKQAVSASEKQQLLEFEQWKAAQAQKALEQLQTPKPTLNHLRKTDKERTIEAKASAALAQKETHREKELWRKSVQEMIKKNSA